MKPKIMIVLASIKSTLMHYVLECFIIKEQLKKLKFIIISNFQFKIVYLLKLYISRFGMINNFLWSIPVDSFIFLGLCPAFFYILWIAGTW